MPRKPHPDLEPIVWVDEKLMSERMKYSAYSNKRFGVFIYQKKSYREHYKTIYAHLENHLKEVRQKRHDLGLTPIDEGLMYSMMMQCQHADHKPEYDKKKKNVVTENNMCALRLKSVGCRIVKTQEEIAEQFCCSVDKVGDHIGYMREEGIIVNWSKGWNEFDARYVWNGDSALRDAYIKCQPCKAEMIVTHGKATLHYGFPDDEIA